MAFVTMRDRRLEIMAAPSSEKISAAIPLVAGRAIAFGRISEITGPPSAGKMALAACAVKAALASRAAQVAWVDAGRSFFPPAFAAASIAVEKVLVVRPRDGAEGDEAARQAAWAADVLLRSHEIDLVVLDLPGMRLSSPALARLSHHARQSDAALLLVTDAAHAGDAAVALSLRTVRRMQKNGDVLHIHVLKARGAPAGDDACVPLAALHAA